MSPSDRFRPLAQEGEQHGAGPPGAPADAVPAPPFAEALRFWLKLGFIGFGGPAGQIALLHDELVSRRRWISPGRFQHALNYCMLLPGPEAQQLATYLGWLMHRTRGGIAAGALFVLPSLLILVVLSALYMAYGDRAWMAGLFYGIKPAVVALVLQATVRMGLRTLTRPFAWALALAAFVALTLVRVPFPAVVLAAAVCGGFAGRWAPTWLAPAVHGTRAVSTPAQRPQAWIDDHTPPPAHARYSPRRLARIIAVAGAGWVLPWLLLGLATGFQGTLATMALFFTQAALLTFGGAYAVLPFVYQGAVVTHGWLSGGQMIDGLALGETTPGPLIMVVAFVGFVGGWQSPDMAALLGPQHRLWAGVAAACVATWFTFLPSFAFILAGGPLVEATHGRIGFTAPLTAISAAVVGVIATLAAVFGGHVLWPQGLQGPFDAFAAGLAALAAVALVAGRRGVVPVIFSCAVAGLAWHLLA